MRGRSQEIDKKVRNNRESSNLAKAVKNRTMMPTTLKNNNRSDKVVKENKRNEMIGADSRRLTMTVRFSSSSMVRRTKDGNKCPPEEGRPNEMKTRGGSRRLGTRDVASFAVIRSTIRAEDPRDSILSS